MISSNFVTVVKQNVFDWTDNDINKDLMQNVYKLENNFSSMERGLEHSDFETFSSKYLPLHRRPLLGIQKSKNFPYQRFEKSKKKNIIYLIVEKRF